MIPVLVAACVAAVWFLVLRHAGGVFHAGVHRVYRARHTEAAAPPAGPARRRAVGVASVPAPLPPSTPIGAS